MSWLATWWQDASSIPPYTTLVIDDLPEEVHSETIYLVGKPRRYWCAVFQCPCECGEIVYLPLLPGARPRWRVKKHQNETVSIMPSVWRHVGCKSHFFIIHGRVRWCRLIDRDRLEC